MKSIFISGGTSGINLGIALKFAEQGNSVLVFGRDAAKAAAAADIIRSRTKGTAMAGSADVRNFEAVRALFNQAAEEIGRPNVVIAGAAGNFVSPAIGLSANGFKSVIDIDVLGTYNVFRASFDLLEKPDASLIAITAPQAVQPLPGQVHVCAAKAGVNMIVKVLAMEWGPAGVRVNAISPGPIEGTEGVERMAPSSDAKSAWIRASALRRFGTRDDIANAALFLTSNEASFITGAILDCDGGMSLGNAEGDYLSPPTRKQT